MSVTCRPGLEWATAFAALLAVACARRTLSARIGVEIGGDEHMVVCACGDDSIRWLPGWDVWRVVR